MQVLPLLQAYFIKFNDMYETPAATSTAASADDAPPVLLAKVTAEEQVTVRPPFAIITLPPLTLTSERQKIVFFGPTAHLHGGDGSVCVHQLLPDHWPG